MSERDSISTAPEAAAAWYTRMYAAGYTQEDRRAFQNWLRADSAHEVAWRAIENASGHIDAAAQDERLRAMLAEALHNPDRPTHHARRFAIAAAIMLAIGAGSFASWRAFSPSPTAPAVIAREYRTGIGERKTVTLADGTHVTLNAASELRVDESRRERRVQVIRGQAYFQVAKDPTRPFVVSAAAHRVTALGTRFDVDIGVEQFRVALVEGSVRVDEKGGKSWILSPGTVLTARGDEVRLASNRAGEATGWLHHMLTFDTTPLQEVVEEMNRYSDRKIVLDPALRARPFSGALRTNGAQALIAALENYRIARVEHADDERIKLAPY